MSYTAILLARIIVDSGSRAIRRQVQAGMVAERISAKQHNPGWRSVYTYVTLRNVKCHAQLLRVGINLLRLGMYITAHARKSTGRFTQGPCRGRLFSGKNDYTGARTVVRSWRARRRAVAAAIARARQDLRVRIPSKLMYACEVELVSVSL